MSYLMIRIHPDNGKDSIDVSAACIDINVALTKQVSAFKFIIDFANKPLDEKTSCIEDELESALSSKRLLGLEISAYSWFINKIGNCYHENFKNYMIVENINNGERDLFLPDDNFIGEYIKLHCDGRDFWWSGYDHHSGIKFFTSRVPFGMLLGMTIK